MNTRRQFLITAPVAAIAAAAACRTEPQNPSPSSSSTAGAPPTFGTGPVTGPPVSGSTFAEAEKLAQVTMTQPERDMAAASWQRTMAPLLERRVGPRKVALAADVSPATRWDPTAAAAQSSRMPAKDLFVRSSAAAAPLPAGDADIAYAPVTQLSRWIEQKA